MGLVEEIRIVCAEEMFLPTAYRCALVPASKRSLSALSYKP